MIISISNKNSKLGNVPSISTLPGAAMGCSAADTSACDPDNDLRDADGYKCYAAKAAVMYKNVRTAWGGNLQLATDDLPEYERQIIAWLDLYRPKRFHWHVSGDILSLEYAEMMIRVAKAHPSIQFLAYTKAVRVLVAGGKKLAGSILQQDNLELYVSSMSPAQFEYLKSHSILSHYPIAHAGDVQHKEMITCPEQVTGGKVKCDTCRVCWTGRYVRFIPH